MAYSDGIIATASGHTKRLENRCCPNLAGPKKISFEGLCFCREQILQIFVEDEGRVCTRYVNSGVDQTFWFCSDMVHVIFFPLDDLVDWVGYDGVRLCF